MHQRIVLRRCVAPVIDALASLKELPLLGLQSPRYMHFLSVDAIVEQLLLSTTNDAKNSSLIANVALGPHPATWLCTVNSHLSVRWLGG